MKLPTLLKSLHEDERKEFEKFLQSPFFKASEQYLAFFRYLCKHHKGLEVGKAELEAAYRRCFGKGTYTESKLYSLMSGMAKQVEEFMAVKQMLSPHKDSPISLSDLTLMQALGERNISPYFRQETERLIETLEAYPVKSQDDYHSMEQLNFWLYFNPDTPKHKAEQPSLPLAAQNLDLYYCVAKLRYAAEMKTREQILNVSYDIPMLGAVMDYATVLTADGKHPLIALYNSLVKLYLEGISEDRFKGIRQLFSKNFDQLPSIDQRTLLVHLINCGIVLNARENNVNEEMLMLYKLAIAKDMLLENQRITPVTFSNIVAVAAFCDEFDWAEKFIADYAPQLEPAKRKATEAISFATVHFSRGNLDKAQECLIAEVFQSEFLNIAGRLLLLKIAFERYLMDASNYEFLNSTITAFEKYVIGKESLPTERKTALLNHIKFVRKLAKEKDKNGRLPKDAKQALKTKLDKTSPIIARKWLEDKITCL